MSFGIEDPFEKLKWLGICKMRVNWWLTFIQIDVFRIVECQIPAYQSVSEENHYRLIESKNQPNLQILQHFRKPETLSIINEPRIGLIHIVNPRKRNRCLQMFLKARNRTGGPIKVFGVSGDTPSIEIGFKDFGTEVVIF